MAIDTKKIEKDRLNSRKTYLNDRKRQLQDQLRKSGLTSKGRKRIQDKLNSVNKQLKTVNHNISNPEKSMSKLSVVANTARQRLIETSAKKLNLLEIAIALVGKRFTLKSKRAYSSNARDLDLSAYKYILDKDDLDTIAKAILEGAEQQGVTLVAYEDTDNKLGVSEDGGRGGEPGVYLSFKGSTDEVAVYYSAEQHTLALG